MLPTLSWLQAGAAASALVADLAAAQQAQAQLEDRLLAAQAALLQQKQQHKHDVSNTAQAAARAALVTSLHALRQPRSVLCGTNSWSRPPCI
jgi:hypothetical protein